MEYRQRSYCSKTQRQTDYDLEIAYELGAEYQRELIEHKEEMQNRKKKRKQMERGKKE